MDEIIAERTESILRIELNRPTKRNAMTSRMYVTLADLLNEAAKDDGIRAALWHGAGDSFCAGNDIQDFLKNPPGPGESPQARLMSALVDFDKPLVAAVQGNAIGGGILLGLPFDARRAADLGLVTRVVPDGDLLATATDTARTLATKPVSALQASKRLLKRPFGDQINAAITAENEAFSAQVRSDDAKEALAAFLEKRPPRFDRTIKSATAA
jgi:enoyl-CoA hydratase/carnithine racemase